MQSHSLVRAWCMGTLVATAAVLSLASAAHAQSYSWRAATIGGGGYVPAIVAHPAQQGLFYARTDVGGAYRYDVASGAWTPLLDGLAPSQRIYNNIQAVAVDPNNTNMLYLAAGGGGDWNVTCCGGILISYDRGASFGTVPLSFQINGNEANRQVGERLQVDPNLGSTLFLGTANNAGGASTNGLWKSTNNGWNWSRVTGFPAMSNDGSGAGVSFVALQKSSGSSGTATLTLFAGISTQAAANAGQTLYRSTNGGANWSLVTGGPSGKFPQRGQIGPDGHLYITYSAGTDVGSLSAGQVWKYNIAGNSWTNITPPNDSQQLAGWTANYGFAGLSVDPTRSGVIAVMTADRYDGFGESLFRSTNGGQAWVNTSAKASFDTSSAPWQGSKKNLANWGGVTLDPFNPDHAFVPWAGGIWSTSNLTASANGGTVNFKLDQKGVEESVPLALASPNTFSWGGSVPVVSAMGDLCGLYHASLTQSPSTTFTNPGCSPVGNSTSIDWAKNKSHMLVRVGTGAGFPGGISYSGGSSWTAFASTPAGVSKGGGSVAVNVDGSAILWAPTDSNVTPALSTTNATSWSATSLPAGAFVVSDGAAAGNFFAYHQSTGNFYTSLDKGVSWNLAATVSAWQQNIATPFGKGCDIWLHGSNGLYHNTNCGWSSWTLVAGTKDVGALGFGKAAAGQSYPAIYMGGTYNNVAGVFRSVDGGTTWVRINGNANQYGGFRLLTGDPKTFGTVYGATNAARGVIVGTSPN